MIFNYDNLPEREREILIQVVEDDLEIIKNFAETRKIDIVFTVNGKEINYIEFHKRYWNNFSTYVKREAEELLKEMVDEAFHKIMEKLQHIQIEVESIYNIRNNWW